MLTRKLSGIVWTPFQYVTLHFRDRRGAALLRYKNPAGITVLKQSPMRNGFRAGAKSIRYSVSIA